MQKNNSLPDYDVAIIGGGASGIYTAWRMLLQGTKDSPQLKKWIKARGKLKIAVFEASDRIGGRILSAKSPHLPNVVCEIGGMRYVSSQTLVQSLVENKFDLPRHEQVVGEAENILLLRGKKMRTKDLSDPKKLPYKLSKDETDWLNASKNNTADNFLGYAVEKIFPTITKYSGDALREFLNKQKINGVPLYKIGFWNLVATQLSHEAYRIAVTTVGYDCLGFNVNSVDAICEYFDFTPGVKYYLLDGGYDSLFWTMQKEFEQAGGEVLMDSALLGFDQVKLADNSKGVVMQFKGSKKTFSTRAIVLAMPKRSLELLEQKGPVLDFKNTRFRFMMNSVAPIHLYKMFIAYDSPWWEKEGVTQGRSITDIPIRQCYYWGTESKAKNGAPGNSNSVVMVYNDALSADFWGGLRLIPLGAGDVKTDVSDFKFRPRKQLALKAEKLGEGNRQLIKNWKGCKVPMEMVKEMHRELMILHGVSDAPKPIDAAFMDWGDDPYGGAVHFWNPGYQSTVIMNEMAQPVDKFPCYICGEAYSNGQTWVEGAFQTSEIILQTHFKIAKPDWLPKSKK